MDGVNRKVYLTDATSGQGPIGMCAKTWDKKKKCGIRAAMDYTPSATIGQYIQPDGQRSAALSGGLKSRAVYKQFPTHSPQTASGAPKQ